ncbi:MAG: aminoglycoside phosphotransferase family protein [Proteobacteria bacterium]|nr:MAG: aminoglycoside phosphotransferase family protein [Pseudomonadota bacterium]
MRTPDHLLVKQKCREAIPRILKEFGFDPSSDIIMDDQGWVNPCFFIGREAIVRFNARDQHIPKFQREKIVYDRLRTLNFPVPAEVRLDTSKTISPYDILIASRLNGSNLEQHWKLLESSAKSTLAFQAGQWLRKIHDVNIDTFGEISAFGPFPSTVTWPEYLKARLEYHLSEARELDIFSAELEMRFEAAFEKIIPLLEQTKRSRLIHGDFHLGNLLFEKHQITGILDFEWSCAGDPLFDLCKLRDMDASWTGSQESFNRGYGVSVFDDSEFKKMRIYTMIQNIELCVVAKKYFPAKELRSYVSATAKGFQT